LHLGHIILIACCGRWIRAGREIYLNFACICYCCRAWENFVCARSFPPSSFFFLSTHDDKKTLGKGGKTLCGRRQEVENQMKVPSQRLRGSLKHFKLPNVKDCVYAVEAKCQVQCSIELDLWPKQAGSAYECLK